MDTYCKDIHRESNFISSFITTLFPPFLGTFTLTIMLPVFLTGCSAASEDFAPVHAGSKSSIAVPLDNAGIKTLDIFVFKDDKLQKLDCYQRFDDMDDWNGTVTSGSGNRIITAVANTLYDREDWMALNSRAYLRKVHIRLEDEDTAFPFMSGEISAVAGQRPSSFKDKFSLYPFASEIRLNSISCDFTGKAYSGEKITEVKVYLTNVNAECVLSDEGGQSPMRIINAGGLCEDDVEGFRQKDLIMRRISREIGKSGVYPDIRLWCYQNNHPDETPGTPFTRLVIEGQIAGQTYYWPININRGVNGGNGILRNHRYEYDIMITGKGSADPDTPVSSEKISIKLEVKEWKETEEYPVSF